MSTSVVLEVTPPEPVDPNRRYDLPADVRALLSGAGQTWAGALARSGDGPWRYCLRVSGPDRLELGRRLEREVRDLGYEVDLRVGR